MYILWWWPNTSRRDEFDSHQGNIAALKKQAPTFTTLISRKTHRLIKTGWGYVMQGVHYISYIFLIMFQSGGGSNQGLVPESQWTSRELSARPSIRSKMPWNTHSCILVPQFPVWSTRFVQLPIINLATASHLKIYQLELQVCKTMCDQLIISVKFRIQLTIYLNKNGSVFPYVWRPTMTSIVAELIASLNFIRSSNCSLGVHTSCFQAGIADFTIFAIVAAGTLLAYDTLLTLPKEVGAPNLPVDLL